MACVETMAGSPSRGTELTCIQYRNTALRQRGLYILGEYITVVCRYSKTTALTGRDRMLPHALDAFSGDFTIQALAIAHPFAQLLARIAFPNRPDVLQLYETYLFVNVDQLFTTEDLSSVLKSVTLPALGAALGIRKYRHVAIAFRKFHCSEFERLVESDERDTAGALQAGHSRVTENQIYAISSGFLAGQSDDTIKPYLRTSATWQNLLRIPPGGRFIAYTLLVDPLRWEDRLQPLPSASSLQCLSAQQLQKLINTRACLCVASDSCGPPCPQPSTASDVNSSAPPPGNSAGSNDDDHSLEDSYTSLEEYNVRLGPLFERLL